MPKYFIRTIWSVLFACLCTGCANMNGPGLFRAPAISVERNVPAEKPNRLKEVDLAKLIDKDATDVDDALRNFRRRCEGAVCRVERNSIQDRLVAASNAICSEYKSELKEAHAKTNLQFGGASTVLGGLGALAQSANPAKLFSGSASIASGLRAEMNQTLYSMLAIEVITKAIDKARTDALREIDASQRNVVANYSLERAIADAVEYHSKCSLLAGLQEASTAVSQSESVGLKVLGKTLSDLGVETQIRLGKKDYQINTNDVTFIRTACSAADARYQRTLKESQIDPSKPAFKVAAERWDSTFKSPSYCKDLNTEKAGAAGEVDARWHALVNELSTQTDDKERERLVGQIAGQQAAAKAVAATLNAALESALLELQGNKSRLDAADTAVKEMKAVRDEIKTLQDNSDESAIGDSLQRLKRLQAMIVRAIGLIDAAKFAGLKPESRKSALEFAASINNLTNDRAKINEVIARMEASTNPVVNLQFQ